MATSTLTGRTFASSTVSGLAERLDRIDAKMIKTDAQFAAILVDTCYTVATWTNVEGLPVREVSSRLRQVRGQELADGTKVDLDQDPQNGAQREFTSAIPNVGGAAQVIMVELALLIIKGDDTDALNHAALIKNAIRDGVAVQAGKPGDDKMSVDQVRELAAASGDVTTFAAELAARVAAIKAARTAAKIDTATAEQVTDDAPATPQELVNNAASILNAKILRDCEDDLDLTVLAQLVAGLIKQDKINKARRAAVAA